ncbi:transglycosylase SLT domain-containing protein [Pseudomonas monteilii]|uniref:transglycosylase SLT domain-containing protein n=1 Tax=Pseudomonas monteilii TaxID=76759 RepID=UPI0015F8A963|nr:transglycosylase SLT domain-containing protein [Pseudomonas monteilii]MBA6106011.1 transglycosylase SLT domain-containing protein [Pseudomonas monteilii]
MPIIIVFLISLLVSVEAQCEVPPPTYLQVALQQGVPAEYLYAVAQTESNTELTIGHYPWPWTLNVAGQPKRFATFKEACVAANIAVNTHGGRAVDIGIGQLNWGYNGRRFFSTPCESLMPRRNLQIAAMLLRGHYEETGNWLEAAGRYHRPAGGEPARRYKKEIERRLSKITVVTRQKVTYVVQK